MLLRLWPHRSCKLDFLKAVIDFVDELLTVERCRWRIDRARRQRHGSSESISDARIKRVSHSEPVGLERDA